MENERVVAEWDGLGQAWKRLRQRRPKAQAELLKPREAWLPSYMGVVLGFTFLLPLLGIFSLLTKDWPLTPVKAAPGLIMIAFGLSMGLLMRRSLRRNIRWKDSPLVLEELPELNPVADLIDPVSVLFDIILVYQSGPEVALFPELNSFKLRITKRFWTEFSLREQRCAVIYISQFRWIKARSLRIIAWSLSALMVFLFTVVPFWFGNRVAEGIIWFAVALPIAFALAERYVRLSAVAAWRNAALESEAPDAPILILKKLIEETTHRGDRLDLERTLKAYEACVPDVQWEVEQLQRDREIARLQAQERLDRAQSSEAESDEVRTS